MNIGGYKRYRHRCDIAEKIGYEQAEREVIASNKSAVGLYEKLGFKIYGIFPNSMKYGEGSYADAYWMMKKLGILLHLYLQLFLFDIIVTVVLNMTFRKKKLQISDYYPKYVLRTDVFTGRNYEEICFFVTDNSR